MKSALQKLMGGPPSSAPSLLRSAGPAHRKPVEPSGEDKPTRDSEYRRVYLVRKKKAGGEKKD